MRSLSHVSSLLELRVLEGPNLYFPRAAIKLTVDVEGLSTCSVDNALRFSRRIGLASVRPGEAGSGFRQRFALRAVARLVRAIAAETGTTRLAVRVRSTANPQTVVVAFPWRQRGRAIALGEAVGRVLDGLGAGHSLEIDVDEAVTAAARVVSDTELGPGPTTITPRIPVVAVTGTNGKTTTSRLIAHIARMAGKRVGWSSTDGIYVDGELVEAGDYSGPSGAGRVLAQPGVEFAVTETARGGILLKGIGLTRNDVSVVTNVSSDHLGLHGIDTVDQLAEVKAVVPRITKASGWAVLNADDPRVFAMRRSITARPWAFSRDPDAPAIRETLEAGGRATTVIDDQVAVLRSGADPIPLLAIDDIPMTLAGLSRFNVENALAAASAGLAAGFSADEVAAGLRDFRPDPAHNPGRMNVFSLPVEGGTATVVMDLAHNEAGLEALMEILAGVRAPGARVLLGLGAVGDRQDDVIEALGEIGAMRSDVVAIAHKINYLRGRERQELEDLLRTGAARVGVTDIAAYDTEVECLATLSIQARDGDVVGLMCHAEREACYAWIAEHRGSVDTPETLREKVRAGRV